MKEEIANLEACQTGHVIDGSVLARLKAANPHIRIIPSRWVSADKSATRGQQVWQRCVTRFMLGLVNHIRLNDGK